MGIRAKLFLCLLAVLIPLAAVSIFAIRLFDKQLMERTESALANTQRLEAARISEVLTSYAHDARSLATGIHVKQFVAATNSYRNEKQTLGNPEQSINQDIDRPIIGGYDGFAIVNPDAPWPLQQLALALRHKAGVLGSAVVQVRLVDRKGKTLGESLGFTWEPADKTLVSRSMRTVKTLFGDAFVSADNHQRLGMVSPVQSEQGEVVGALILEARLGPITDMVAKHEGVGYSSEAHIAQPTINGHAQVITALRFDRKAAFNKIIPQSRNLPINQALKAYGGRIIKARDYRGIQSILAIETIAQTGWGLVVKIDEAEAYAPLVELRRVLAIAAALSIVVSLIGYTFCLVPIAQRLQKTARAARKIMDGDLTARVQDADQDEIGRLARTIDTLARDLELDQRKRIEVEARLRHQALHDELTGLLNRKHANKVIMQLNEDSSKSHSVMFLDLNGFKDVNDLYGHSVGDEVLISVAKRLTRQITDGATLARWGGDEFVIILPDTEENDATDFALALHNVFDDPFVTSQGTHNISCSIGLATSSDTKSLDNVLMEADILMYEQKKRQKLQKSPGSMATRTVERALNENRVEVLYQPMVRYNRPGSYELVGAEALVRVRSRDGGIILPDDFIQEITSSELGTYLDRRVLSLSLNSMARWRSAGIVTDEFKLAINVTKQSLNDPSFSAILSNELQMTAIHPANIIVELPDQNTINSTLLCQLRTLGVTIALDQLGADPKRISYTSQQQNDLVKIDRQWITDTVVAPHIVAMCKELGLEIMIEGIESREQLSSLHGLGVTLFQGHLFDRPLRAVDFISRWGQSSVQGLGRTLDRDLALRLAG